MYIKIVRNHIRIQRKKTKGGSIKLYTLKRIFLLGALLFITGFTVIVAQNRQDLIQHADVTYSAITPQFHCLTLGVSHCSGVASSAVTTCPGLTVVTPLKLDKISLEQEETIQGTIGYQNQCSIPYDISSILINATDPNKKTYPFMPQGGKTTLLPGQIATVAATLMIGAKDPPGTWTAFGSYVDSTGTAHPDKTVSFTVCGPLIVSSAISLNKTTVYQGQTITGQITYKNICKYPYAIKDAKISARDPKGTIKDFTPNTGAKTIAANNGTLVVNASRAMSTDTTQDPLGTWKAFGSYEDAVGTWVSDSTMKSFTLAPPPPPAVAKPGSNTTSKTCPAPLASKVTVLFPTYTGGAVTLPSSYTTQLTTYATALNSNKTVSVTINGYTDATPFAAGTTGSITSNQSLSLARATAVKNYLAGKASATKYTVTGKGVAPGATSNDAADRKADVISSCSSNSSTPASSGSQPATNTGSTCTTNCGNSTACQNLSGTCEIKGTHTTGGSYVASICPGGTTWQCWVPGSANTSTPNSNASNGTCTNGESTKNGCTCPTNTGFVVGGVCNICPAGEVPGAGYQCIKPSTSCASKGQYTYNGTCVGVCPATAPWVYNGACVSNCPAAAPYLYQGLECTSTKNAPPGQSGLQ